MKNIEIKSVIDGKVIYVSNKSTLKEAVIEAVKNGVRLRKANLCDTDLSRANLSYADLSYTDLSYADLSEADLSYADLSYTDLSYADLRGANLSYANLNCVIMYHAKLSNTNLSNTNLSKAILKGANLRGAKNIPFVPLACPSEGSFIGWKKILKNDEGYNGCFLVKLKILEDSKRSSATTNKCRCDKALVLSITSLNDGTEVDKITNINTTTCVYKVGEIVYPDSFDEDRWNECSHGIHFFINKEEAINYLR